MSSFASLTEYSRKASSAKLVEDANKLLKKFQDRSDASKVAKKERAPSKGEHGKPRILANLSIVPDGQFAPQPKSSITVVKPAEDPRVVLARLREMRKSREEADAMKKEQERNRVVAEKLAKRNEEKRRRAEVHERIAARKAKVTADLSAPKSSSSHATSRSRSIPAIKAISASGISNGKVSLVIKEDEKPVARTATPNILIDRAAPIQGNVLPVKQSDDLTFQGRAVRKLVRKHKCFGDGNLMDIDLGALGTSYDWELPAEAADGLTLARFLKRDVVKAEHGWTSIGRSVRKLVKKGERADDEDLLRVDLQGLSAGDDWVLPAEADGLSLAGFLAQKAMKKENRAVRKLVKKGGQADDEDLLHIDLGGLGESYDWELPSEAANGVTLGGFLAEKAMKKESQAIRKLVKKGGRPDDEDLLRTDLGDMGKSYDWELPAEAANGLTLAGFLVRELVKKNGRADDDDLFRFLTSELWRSRPSRKGNQEKCQKR